MAKATRLPASRSAAMASGAPGVGSLADPDAAVEVEDQLLVTLARGLNGTSLAYGPMLRPLLLVLSRWH